VAPAILLHLPKHPLQGEERSLINGKAAQQIVLPVSTILQERQAPLMTLPQALQSQHIIDELQLPALVTARQQATVLP
jgi:hypothetical protein